MKTALLERSKQMVRMGLHLLIIPVVGMTYESSEQIGLHFRCYAKQNGFAVTRVGVEGKLSWPDNTPRLCFACLEDSESYGWLFTTWLRCVRGKAPTGILTDQDAVMKKAIANAFPDSRHRWCLWHILQKFYTKLGSYDHYETFSEGLQYAIYDSPHP